MILVDAYFYISSILFLIGANYLSKQICKKLEITKELTFIISLSIILTLCLISYSFNIFNFKSIKYLNIFLYNFFVLLSIISIFKKVKNLKLENKTKDKYQIIYFFIILNILLVCLIPVNDADSVRYHFGQFNSFDLDKSFNLHEKISFIGDSLNHIAMSNNNFNLTSLLSLMCLIKLINLIKKEINLSNRITFYSILLGIPIYLNLMISQKPYLWVCFSLIYLIFLFHKNFQKLFKKNDIIVIFIFLILSLISKPEFLFVNIIFIFCLFLFYSNNEKTYFIAFAYSLPILIFFLIINFSIFGDPLKILLVQKNIAEENFVNFLSNSNQSFSFSELLNFLINIMIPLNFFSNFTTSFGIIFFISLFFLDFKKKKYPIIFLIIVLFLVNIITLRIFIDENHSRNYTIIFFLILLIALENKKFLNNLLVKFLVIIQLIISQFSIFYFNYDHYINKNYNEFAYQYENEKFISKLANSRKDTIVLSEIDGNFFKDYQYLNIDIYNFSPSVYFDKTSNFLQNEDKINNIIIVLKKEMRILEEYLFLEKLFIISGRNPFNEKKEKYFIYKINKSNFLNLINKT